MQDDLASSYPNLHINLLGINEFGQESANSLAVAGRDLPWMQDGDTNTNALSDVWDEQWKAEWRDVIVLNGANEKVFVYNLTSHDLGNATNYQTLRDVFVKTAIQDQRKWCNPDNVLDVDRDGSVALSDFNAVISFLNAEGSKPLSNSTTPTAQVDCDFDGFAAPIDALRVINAVNLQSLGEGEGAAGTDSADLSASILATPQSLATTSDSAGERTVAPAAANDIAPPVSTVEFQSLAGVSAASDSMAAPFAAWDDAVSVVANEWSDTNSLFDSPSDEELAEWGIDGLGTPALSAI